MPDNAIALLGNYRGVIFNRRLVIRAKIHDNIGHHRSFPFHFCIVFVSRNLLPSFPTPRPTTDPSSTQHPSHNSQNVRHSFIPTTTCRCRALRDTLCTCVHPVRVCFLNTKQAAWVVVSIDALSEETATARAARGQRRRFISHQTSQQKRTLLEPSVLF